MNRTLSSQHTAIDTQGRNGKRALHLAKLRQALAAAFAKTLRRSGALACEY
jgi:hypothetical protein